MNSGNVIAIVFDLSMRRGKEPGLKLPLDVTDSSKDFSIGIPRKHRASSLQGTRLLRFAEVPPFERLAGLFSEFSAFLWQPIPTRRARKRDRTALPPTPLEAVHHSTHCDSIFSDALWLAQSAHLCSINLS